MSRRKVDLSRREFLQRMATGVMGTALGHALPVGAKAQPNKLNVLFFAVDDLSSRLGCYGHPIVQSPNIDRIAARGVRFVHAYCQYPLCNPSRTSLLTGRYPTTTQVMDNLRYFRDTFPDWVTLPQHFRDSGYVTARTGKIFHGGIDDEKSWIEGSEPRVPRKPRTPLALPLAAGAPLARVPGQIQYRTTSDRWLAVEGDGQDQPDYRTASRAIQLLEKYKDQPFFIAVGFVKPHSPLIAPKRFFDLYDPAKIPLPPDFAPKPTVGPGVPEEALSPNGDLFVAPHQLRSRWGFVVSLRIRPAMADNWCGVLGELERLNLHNNTVIVLFGDHGYHLGEKGKWSKHGSLYEVTARVPLLIAAPGVQGKGKACARTVELLDIYPTLAELCGLPPIKSGVPQGLEGQSFVPLLNNPQAQWNHPAYTVATRGPALIAGVARGGLEFERQLVRGFGRSVRIEQYRYTEWDREGKKAELYDHQADPNEMHNLAGEPGHATMVKELRELLRAGLPAAL